MASQEEQLRLVAEVVDKFSPQLKQMLKSFQQISAAGKEVHEKGTKQTNEHAKAYKELGERVDRFRKFGVEALTPALGALGLAGFGVAESIKKMTESLQNAGEKYRWLQDITARGGVSAGYVDTMTRTFENMGIAGDKAVDAVARLGETFDKLKFGDPQEYQRLFSIFGNTLPYLDNIVKGARDREDAMTRIAKSITDTSIPIFQRRQLAEGLGLDPALYGTHSLRRTKVALIYKRTGNLRACQLLLGHSKLESTVRYLGIEVDDALLLSEQTDL